MSMSRQEKLKALSREIYFLNESLEGFRKESEDKYNNEIAKQRDLKKGTHVDFFDEMRGLHGKFQVYGLREEKLIQEDDLKETVRLLKEDVEIVKAASVGQAIKDKCDQILLELDGLVNNSNESKLSHGV